MAIPGFQKFLLPLLQFCGDGKSHTLSEAATHCFSELNISEDELMWKMYYELAAVYSQDKNGIVVLDATNRSRKYRIECVRELKTHFDEADLVIFDIPKEIVMKQNLEREFPVPEFVLEEYFREFEPPTKEDYEFFKNVFIATHDNVEEIIKLL